MEHIIKFYPVGNADCTLIKLDNGKTIIVDCQILADLTDGHGKQVMFDIKADLLKELNKDSLGRPFVDLFISTHPHDDHCNGFCHSFRTAPCFHLLYGVNLMDLRAHPRDLQHE